MVLYFGLFVEQNEVKLSKGNYLVLHERYPVVTTVEASKRPLRS
jgi:hypothetical protein